MAKKYTTYRTLKKWVRVFIKTMIIVFFAVGIFLIYKSLNLSAPVKEILLAYDIEQTPNYKVNIVDNNYIDEDSLQKNNNYVTNLVSSIDLNFNYLYEATKPGDYEYNYDVKATIYGKYQSNSEGENSSLWTKEYVLLENTLEKVKNKNTININKTVNLDFPKYNNEVVNFKNDLNVPITGYMEVVMTINLNGNASNNKIKDVKTEKFIIPLNQLAFSISTDTKKNDHQEIVYTKDNRSINMVKFDIGILMIVYSITLLVLTFKLIFNVRSKSKYESELDRILKSYGDVIIELATMINLDGKDTVLVKSFNEMLDLEEELRIPINFIQTAKNKGEFFIINNDICYKWVLSE